MGRFACIVLLATTQCSPDLAALATDLRHELDVARPVVR
jgi:hypothetical protein